MRIAFLVLMAALSAVTSGDEQAPDALAGSWTVKVENLKHEVVTTMVVRFTDAGAQSCMGGDWRRVYVDSTETSNKNFFPSDEPLSYELRGDHLIIGRNEVCDGYLQLEGTMRGTRVTGNYLSIGLGGSSKEGYVSMRRDFNSGS